MLRSIGLALTFVAIWAAVSAAEDRRTEKSRLVVMTLNAEFLWDGVDPEEGQVQFPWKGSQSEAEEHMQAIATVIVQQNPDIENLVEVENLEALTRLNDGFLSGRGYRPYLQKGKDTYTGQDVGLLTRIDPEGGAIERDDRNGVSGNTTKGVTKNYYAKFNVNHTKIALIALHLLADPNSLARKPQREAQADAIRTLAKELLGQGYHLIVLGDFNDYDGAEASRDHIDSMPTTNVLSWITELDPATPKDNLVNAASMVPKTQRYTAFWDQNGDNNIDPSREYTSIDHILVSSELAGKITLADIPHNYDPRQVSDHFPVVAHFTFATVAGPTPGARPRISRLIPNPSGNESQNETVWLRNSGSQPVDLAGWKLRDLANTTWKLDSLGVLQPGQEKELKRQGQQMALNNSGDTVDLLNPSGEVVQSVTYSSAAEDEEIPVAE